MPARAGAALVLVGLSVTLREQLDQAKVSALYTTFPSVAYALLALGATPAAAELSPGGAACSESRGAGAPLQSHPPSRAAPKWRGPPSTHPPLIGPWRRDWRRHLVIGRRRHCPNRIESCGSWC